MSQIKSLTETEYKDLVSQLQQTDFGKGESWSNGKYKFQMFPEGYIALNRELSTGLHPKLEKLLQQQPADEIDIKLAQIAAYCSVILDGTYTIAEYRDWETDRKSTRLNSSH